MGTEHTKWEYLFVVCSADVAYGSENKPRFEVVYVNGESEKHEYEKEVNTALIGTKMEIQKFMRGPMLENYLQEKGKEGWEVCSSSEVGDRIRFIEDFA